MKEKLKEIEKYAEENSVPIIEKNSIAFIMKYIQDNNVKNILEIGSAIGYSAILMASAKDDVYVTTIERDEKRYLECVKNKNSFLAVFFNFVASKLYSYSFDSCLNPRISSCL